jgi:hypothetical protein
MGKIWKGIGRINVATEPVKLARNTNVANAINEAAEWNERAIDGLSSLNEMIASLPPAVAQAINQSLEASVNVSRWLDRTGVVDSEPPSIMSKKF